MKIIEIKDWPLIIALTGAIAYLGILFGGPGRLLANVGGAFIGVLVGTVIANVIICPLIDKMK